MGSASGLIIIVVKTLFYEHQLAAVILWWAKAGHRQENNLYTVDTQRNGRYLYSNFLCNEFVLVYFMVVSSGNEERKFVLHSGNAPFPLTKHVVFHA